MPEAMNAMEAADSLGEGVPFVALEQLETRLKTAGLLGQALELFPTPGGFARWVGDRVYALRQRRRWQVLRELGMQIGECVNLPLSTWIDNSHANLISIGDNCGFGEGCLILAHDAMPNEFLDATRLAPVTIHASCHFGARTVILPGVEIGPRAIVGAGSVVAKSIPADCVAAGSPARVLCSLEEYLERHRRKLREAPSFRYEEAHLGHMTPAARDRMRELVSRVDGYILGGGRAASEGRSYQTLTRAPRKR